MLFPTITFAAFFVLVFVGNWALMSRPAAWKPFILVASLVFYASWDWRFAFLLLGVAAVNQLFAVALRRAGTTRARKGLLAGAVATDLALLGWFKYYGFFVTSAVNFLAAFGLHVDLPLLRVLLPVGISFLTFRVLSYVIDVYRGDMEPATMLDFAIYVAFFPYIMAGPIARAREFVPQLAAPRDPRRVDSSRAFFLIVGGLVKKMLIADYLATHIVNGVFTTPAQYTSPEVLLGIVGYAVQIYCDFSAYSDIAIGVSLLLGFDLPDNFRAPYTAVSVQDFWRRWHITLSSWLRDYLYIPLGGNRKGRTRTYLNLLVTMLLAGLWHGAAWTFVFWGGLQGAGLVVERVRVDRRRRRWGGSAERREAATAERLVPAFAGAPSAALDEADTGDLGPGVWVAESAGLRPRHAAELWMDDDWPAWSGEPRASRAEPGAAGQEEPEAAPAAQERERPEKIIPAPEPAPRDDTDLAWPGSEGFDSRPWSGAVWPRVAVFAFVCLGWVFFRSASFEAALAVLARLFQDWGGIGAAVTPALLLVIAVGIGVQYVPATLWRRGEARFSLLNPAVQGVALALCLMAINVLGPAGPAEFLYFRF